VGVPVGRYIAIACLGSSSLDAMFLVFKFVCLIVFSQSLGPLFHG
jgi:hypothetical protein